MMIRLDLFILFSIAL